MIIPYESRGIDMLNHRKLLLSESRNNKNIECEIIEDAQANLG